jgi:uncharacterized repeat protein (TIGR02543 family)
MKTTIFNLLMLVCTCISAIGANYYVATDGNDSNSGTSTSSPFKTLEKAVSAAVAGDYIYLRGGTHVISTTPFVITKNGTSGANIRVFAYSGETPILQFNDVESTSNRGVVMEGDFWHWKGIIFEKAGDNGMLLSGNNNTIENCIFRKNHDTGLQLSRYNTSATSISQWPSNNLIVGCEAYDNKDSGNENADGFAAKLTCGTGNIFRNCVSHHNIDDGWDLYTNSDTGPIGAVTLEGCIAHNNGTLTDGATSGGGDKNGFKLGSSSNTVDHTLIRCIAFNNGKHGFTDNGNIGNIKFYNLTSYNNVEYNYHTRDNASHTFRNCITLNGGHTDRIVGDAPTSCNGLDDTDTQWTIVVTSADFQTLTPGPNSNPTSNGFLQLKSTSALINKGCSVSGITYNGSAPDLGAIEYGGTTVNYTLTTNVSGSGSVSPSSGTYTSGTAVTLTATPASGWIFSNWSGDASGSSNPVTITMNSNKSVTAVFTQTTTNYTLTTSVVGQGTISPSSGTYAAGTTVTLTATPASGYKFDGWGGALSGTTNPASLTINSNVAVTATFSQISNITTITIQENTTGFCSVNGTVDSDNAGFTGTGFANTTNASGSGVNYKVSFSANGTYTFAFRYASTSDRPARLIINGSTAVSSISFPSTGSWTTWSTVSTTATISAGTFDVRLEATGSSGLGNIDYMQVSGTTPSAASCTTSPTTYTLTTSVSGQGSISPSSGTYNAGSTVTLTATPATGYKFDGWGGALSGTTNPATLTINSNVTITATFSQIPATITLTIQENTTGFCSVDGTVDSNNSGFTGAGFANTVNASGNGITWSVNIPSAGSYSLQWRYANGGSTDRTGQLMVDGSTIVSSVSMPATGSWTTWTTTSATSINLSAGTKLIRLQATNSAGLANIDYINVTGSNPTAVSCTGLKSTRAILFASNGDIRVYPNPVKDGILKIAGYSETGSEVSKVIIYNELGKVVAAKTLGVINQGNFEESLDVENLRSGMYFIRMIMNSGAKTIRFIKE